MGRVEDGELCAVLPLLEVGRDVGGLYLVEQIIIERLRRLIVSSDGFIFFLHLGTGGNPLLVQVKLRLDGRLVALLLRNALVHRANLSAKLLDAQRIARLRSRSRRRACGWGRGSVCYLPPPLLSLAFYRQH